MDRKPDEVSSVLLDRIRQHGDAPDREEVGRVVQVGDSIARIYGLDDCVYGELLEFESGATGMAMNLEEDDVGCMLFTGENAVREGEVVKRTRRVAELGVGPAVLGRVIDSLGQPIDGHGAIESVKTMSIERNAPPVLARKGVGVPLQTGILSIDSMVPIGRGQRQLIIGDRQTGKTAIALDAIIAQKNTGVICVYASIGQKASTTAQVVETLRKHGALANTVVVAATAKTTPALQYLCPYAACAVAEYFMDEGKDVLVIYDDLSKHAVAYRALSLLLRRPPGREAYPGDVFYLHSRLLERAARLDPETSKGGSITALPIIETQGGDISAYIPTNVISITDGQIFLDSELFYAGIRPAIDVGLSVSRVGGAAQTKAVRKIAGRLRLDLAQYRELAAFAQFGSDLDKSTQDRLSHGRLMVEILKQKQYSPYSVAVEVIILYAAVNGYLSESKVENIGKAIETILTSVNYKLPSLLTKLNETGDLDRESENSLKTLLSEFKASSSKKGA